VSLPSRRQGPRLTESRFPAAGFPPLRSPRVVLPTATPGPRTSQDGNECPRSNDAPASKPEEPADPAADVGAEEPSNNDPEFVPDKSPSPPAKDATNDTPITAPQAPTLKSPGVNDASAPETKTAEAIPTPTIDNAANNPLNPTPADAPLPYPTSTPDADVFAEKDGTERGQPVQMPVTPEELVDKIVKELKSKGLVGQ
jgi:hypothetical protein